MNTIIDDEGYTWIFDGNRVYMVLAEIEMDGDPQNGYPCHSLEQALRVLYENGDLGCGYMREDV